MHHNNENGNGSNDHSGDEKQGVVSVDFSQLSHSFADTFGHTENDWMWTLLFGVKASHSDMPNVTYTHAIKMPLPLVKALGIMINRAIRKYEEKYNISIPLPDNTLKDLDIPREDWY